MFSLIFHQARQLGDSAGFAFGYVRNQAKCGFPEAVLVMINDGHPNDSRLTSPENSENFFPQFLSSMAINFSPTFHAISGYCVWINISLVSRIIYSRFGDSVCLSQSVPK
jgi:hypothetical protein